MPSPFPGMDPYLEHPGRWPDVHHSIISEMRTALNVGLKPRYVARVEERIYVVDDNDPGQMVMVPDLRLAVGQGGSPTSSAPIDEPFEATTIMLEDVREPRLEIRHVETDELVTVIEVLSPSNKTPGSSGRESFLKKRREVLNSKVHWVEVDLLRSGRGFLNARLLRGAAYNIHVSRAESRPKGKIWRIELPRPLPTFGVPLRGRDPDFGLNLQSILEAVYEGGSYDVTIDYKQDRVPLQRWMEELRRAGQ